MIDDDASGTELRRQLQAEINAQAADREVLEKQYGKVWDTLQFTSDFEVEGFLAPFVSVRRKSDGQAGTLQFQHMPRFYFSFVGDYKGGKSA
jgi:hypothetical protein